MTADKAPLTAEELASITARRKDALAGPCTVEKASEGSYAIRHIQGLFWIDVGQAPKLARFLASAGDDVDRLLAEIERLE